MTGVWAVLELDDLELACQPWWPTARAIVTTHERRRGERLAPSLRPAWAAAHLLVRACARAAGAHGPSVSLRYDAHGRPSLACGMFVSLAHSRRAVAAAVGTVPCGIDVEAHSATDPAVARAIPAVEELIGGVGASALHRWVALEAYAKFTGHGLAPLLDAPDPRGRFTDAPIVPGTWCGSERVLRGERAAAGAPATGNALSARDWLRVDDTGTSVSALIVATHPVLWQRLHLVPDELLDRAAPNDQPAQRSRRTAP